MTELTFPKGSTLQIIECDSGVKLHIHIPDRAKAAECYNAMRENLRAGAMVVNFSGVTPLSDH